MHDKAKERVYAATLGVSLAADTPQDTRSENAALVALFIKTFAPSFKNPEPSLTAVTTQLGGSDASQRVVLLGDDYKLTVWNNREGQFNFKIESPRVDADE